MSIIAPKICQVFVYREDMQDVPYLAQALSYVIENMRKERNITKSALADFSRLERRYLREIETGAKRPTVNAIYSICEALKIKPEEFFCVVEKYRQKLMDEIK